MVGGVDGLFLIHIGSRVGEISFDLRIGELAERTTPEHRVGGFLTYRSDRVVVLFPQGVIDFDKNIFWTSLTRAHVVQ